jgi:Domain of unknown function (DUF1338)
MLCDGCAGSSQRCLNTRGVYVSGESRLSQLIRTVVGKDAAADILETLQIHGALFDDRTGPVARSVFAMALNAVLFQDLLRRTPTAAAYVADQRRLRERITFDHGALRTVRLKDGPTGALPPGAEAFSRILEPLGYYVAGVYPLERLRMTGHGFAHREFPESLPQFFVSELHAERFSEEFQAAAQRTFGTSRDPLTERAHAALETFALQGECEFATAAAALPEIAAAFGRWHDTPRLADYRLLQAESEEAAWIATEGSVFNHATDRVADVAVTADSQRALGRPIKDVIEISAGGSVRQTAFKADPVLRNFRTDQGQIELTVPGSFYEFISRDIIARPEGAPSLDLRFDSSNAQGIFKMTRAG